MKSALLEFIDSLQKRGLVDLNILGDSEEHFNNRLKLQKYVFLAKYYGVDMHYNYNMYRHGPYSPELAEDYYVLAKHSQLYDAKSKSLYIPDDFFNLISNKNVEWLEVASTLLSLHKYFADRESLLDRAANMKAHIPSETIDLVLTELERIKLIN
jgi:uncharacterized protein YwgA